MITIPGRLRGGAHTPGTKPLFMVDQAIESARKHGIHLSPGVANNADGNCAFESVINNINFRSCFKDKLPRNTQFYRYNWMTDLENQTNEYPTLGAGFSEEEKKRKLGPLKTIWCV